MKKQYFYVYKITNILTGKLYIGCHQTNDLNDGYMGSGKYLKRAYNKYGKENFVKEILSFYPNQEQMFKAEAEIVTREFIAQDNNYNMAPGGKGGFIYHTPQGLENIRQFAKSKISVRDTSGKKIRVTKDDSRWLNKELVGITKGKSTVIDKQGNILKVDSNDPRIGTELVGCTKGKVVAKNKSGQIIIVSNDDPRLKTGELVGHTKGSTQTVESNLKRSKALKGIPKKPIFATCIICKKTTNMGNLVRWHSNCGTTK
jgi:hypothetical protein